MVSNGLTLHPSKTQALSITPFIHKSSPSLSFNLYLGILIDGQLSFKSHLNFLEKKLSRFVGIMAKLSYYLPPNALLTLYHSLVHVHLIYALPVWATTFPTYLIKLKRIQNKAIRIIAKLLQRIEFLSITVTYKY